MTDQQLKVLINGCVNNNRQSQRMLYETFYGFAMSICLRYAGNKYEADEIINEGFYKVFINIKKYDQSRPFKAWLRTIMQHSSIDYIRVNIKRVLEDDYEQAAMAEEAPMIEGKLAYEELLMLIQQLPAAYRAAFNLFVIDGYSHEEIAALLHISAGTSKSNLFKARMKLQKMILQYNEDVNGTTVNADYSQNMDH
ncbi:RNA polymerase sigma factor [Solitalea lacus]|uniref:RNA polymerase sigma factor n=1 Tax=Solitalea lacus TaxID=2911172 RepID=UPI001ED9E5C1|nr:sigma-70 family RNA polymerase sigma factor [Solitalea lacus]UKJ07606.1 sigma-70 family RNA polymerase sigma factor [Solitalea lacus]